MMSSGSGERVCECANYALTLPSEATTTGTLRDGKARKGQLEHYDELWKERTADGRWTSR